MIYVLVALGAATSFSAWQLDQVTDDLDDAQTTLQDQVDLNQRNVDRLLALESPSAAETRRTIDRELARLTRGQAQELLRLQLAVATPRQLELLARQAPGSPQAKRSPPPRRGPIARGGPVARGPQGGRGPQGRPGEPARPTPAPSPAPLQAPVDAIEEQVDTLNDRIDRLCGSLIVVRC